MSDRKAGEAAVAGGGGAAGGQHAQHEPPRKDHFLQLMFFRASREAGEAHEAHPVRATGGFVPLRQAKARPGERFSLPQASATTPVTPESSALDVMTDLRRVGAVTIDPRASIDDVNTLMVARGVRALFVVEDARKLAGIITFTDIQGEKPLQISAARGMRRDELTVRELMTRADRLEVLDLREVQQARVGDIIATLRAAGRQHALVAEVTGESLESGEHTVRGMFSLTQIARQLGIPPQPAHDIAKTFAEIEAAIAY
ncbi:MAG TPA: CBS domain-containing protein [Casimicrobiaceae bacterium]